MNSAPEQPNPSEELDPSIPVDQDVEPETEEQGVSHEMDAMMDEYLSHMSASLEPGQLLKVPIVAIREDHVLVDVGDKAEGLVPRRELDESPEAASLKPGELIDVIVKGHDNESGLVMLSHSDARRRVALTIITEALESQKPIRGRVVRPVKGGLIVDFGTTAFLPASQIDLRRVEDFEQWVGREVHCLVIEHVPEKRRIIVSRRKWLEKQQAEKREQLLGVLKVGQTMTVRVKRLVDFGAFVDLGGIDGLIPRSEISWQRVSKPEDFLKLDQEIETKVIEIQADSGKITLSRRQVMPNPWESVAQKFTAGTTIEGEVVSLTNYGAFVRLEEGIDGMIHISDMSWESGGKRPSDYLAIGQRVQASVINVDPEHKRISLGLKQLMTDPWEGIEERYRVRSRIKGRVTGLTKYGAFVEIEPGIEGMIHVSDFSWDKRVDQPKEMVNRGDEIEACILTIDRQRRRISLGVKQLTDNPVELFLAQHKTGDVVEGEVTSLTDFGAYIKLAEGIEGFIHVSQIGPNRIASPAEVLKVGEKVTAEITKVERETGKISLSRRQMLKRDEKRTLSSYMKSSKGTGATLGELLAEISLEDDLPKE